MTEQEESNNNNAISWSLRVAFGLFLKGKVDIQDIIVGYRKDAFKHRE